MCIAIAEYMQLKTRFLAAYSHQFNTQLVRNRRVFNATVPKHPDLPRQCTPRLTSLVYEWLFRVVDDESVIALGIECLLKERASNDWILLAFDHFLEVAVHLIMRGESSQLPEWSE